MKRLRIFLLGFAVFSLCTPLAQAQDYYESDGGLYWGVRGGLSQVRSRAWWAWAAVDPVYDTSVPPNVLAPGINSHEEWRNLEMDYGFVAGAALGYTATFPESSADLRFELEGIYRKNDDGQTNAQWTPTSDNNDSDSFLWVVSEIDGSLEVRSAMFNVLVDFHTPTRFVPYIGVGAGISQIVADALVWDPARGAYGYGYPMVVDETLYALSWQAIAGVGYRLSPGTMVTLEFRHFRLAADRWSDFFFWSELADVKFDDWSMGVRFTF